MKIKKYFKIFSLNKLYFNFQLYLLNLKMKNQEPNGQNKKNVTN